MKKKERSKKDLQLSDEGRDGGGKDAGAAVLQSLVQPQRVHRTVVPLQ